MIWLLAFVLASGPHQEADTVQPRITSPPLTTAQVESLVDRRSASMASRAIDSVRGDQKERYSTSWLADQGLALVALLLSLAGLWFQFRERSEDKYHAQVGSPCSEALTKLRNDLSTHVEELKHAMEDVAQARDPMMLMERFRDVRKSFSDCMDACSSSMLAWGQVERAQRLEKEIQDLEDEFTRALDEASKKGFTDGSSPLRVLVRTEVGILINSVQSDPCARKRAIRQSASSQTGRAPLPESPTLGGQSEQPEGS